VIGIADNAVRAGPTLTDVSVVPIPAPTFPPR
jgi:hypothetical protein